MIILIYDRNLMWAARLVQSARSLGHEAVMLSDHEVRPGDVAVVNLSDDASLLSSLVAGLRDQGSYVIGHAGHKEKPLLALGNEFGCDRVATNSEITHKFESLLPAV
ncbi:MAG: hypothetical protein KF812_05895 [Fimbriimonadaceae bacterium]|nr:hypothetical protein [Fimbriimonadaceae bacterium]